MPGLDPGICLKGNSCPRPAGQARELRCWINPSSPGLTRRYGLKLLVFFEWHDEIALAIQREKNIKHRSREWKIELIQSMNPEWKDLFETLG